MHLPMGYSDDGRWLSLSKGIGQSALDITDPSVTSGTGSKRFVVSAVRSIETVDPVMSLGVNKDIA